MADPSLFDMGEAQEITRTHRCAECDARLNVIWHSGKREYEIACAENVMHKGYRQVPSPSELARQQDGGPIYLQETMRKRSPILRGLPVQAIIGEAAHRWSLQAPEASAFLRDAMALGLDPFFEELAPLGPFLSKRHEGKRVVIPFITEKGWATLCARECPQDYIPPAIHPVTVTEIAKAYGFGPEDSVWSVEGRRKTWTSEVPNFAWVDGFTQEEFEKAKRDGAPAGKSPQHQGRMRTLRRWHQHMYPEVKDLARSRLAASSEGDVDLAFLDAAIEGEYRVLPLVPQGGPVAPERGASIGGGAASGVSTRPSPPRPRQFTHVGELLNAALAELKMDRSQVLKALEVERSEDIRDLPGAWVRLQTVGLFS